MPYVKATKPFIDRREHATRNVGNEWFCDDERAEQLASFDMVEILGLPKEDEEKPKPKRTKKKAE